MSRAKLSLTVYAIYLGSAGLSIALFPDAMLPILGLPVTKEVWVRLYGALATVLAAKGYNGARLNLYSSMQFDVYTRTSFASFLTALVLLGICPRVLEIFAIIDYTGAAWTQWAIRADRRAGIDTSR